MCCGVCVCACGVAARAQAAIVLSVCCAAAAVRFVACAAADAAAALCLRSGASVIRLSAAAARHSSCMAFTIVHTMHLNDDGSNKNHHPRVDDPHYCFCSLVFAAAADNAAAWVDSTRMESMYVIFDAVFCKYYSVILL